MNTVSMKQPAVLLSHINEPATIRTSQPNRLMILLYYISGRRELTVQSFRLCSSLVYRREIMYRSQAPLQVCSNCKSSAVPDNHHQGPVSVLRKHSRFFCPNGPFNISGACRAKFANIITKCKNRWVIMKN